VKIKAVILAGGEGTRLATLTAKRAKPAVPFAGKYRIIDFTLSNCVNSNIFDVLILTQYRPYKGRKDTDWYAGTADAVAQNLSFVRRGRPDYVLILSGDHIYEMDYDVLLQFHREKNADATICTIRVPMDEASRYGILDVNDDYQVREFVEKPANPPGNLASMGVYIFNYSVMEQMLMDDQKRKSSNHDFGKDIIPRMVFEGMRVFAYPYGGYWIDVGTIDAFWEAHMDLIGSPPSLNLNDRTWVIHTLSEERPPVHIHTGATVRNSMITDGSVISEGAIVENSILSPGVYVGPNAVVRESIILTDTYIEAGAVVERCILDKVVVIGHNARVGKIQDVGELGITCVGKNTHVPAGYSIGSSCILGTDLRLEDFNSYSGKSVPNGTQIGYKK
jgi:glucose-1-phosphate adenylyltransferase